jgi:hypothetical protein
MCDKYETGKHWRIQNGGKTQDFFSLFLVFQNKIQARVALRKKDKIGMQCLL